MILFDTSVWIEFFKQNTQFVEEISPLLRSKKVITIEPIFSELLYGVRHKKDKEKIISYWNVLPKIEFGANAMIQASEFANRNNYYNMGIGLMDAIMIKATIEGNYLIWTFDKKIIKNIDSRFLYSGG